MRFEHVFIDALGYELPQRVVTTEEIEARLAPVYRQRSFQPGQLYALTGIRARRWWPEGQSLADAAARAAKKALAASSIAPSDLGAVIYAGVCRDNLEPATACAVADAIGAPADAEIMDISNACLAVMNGMLHVASAIELGHMRAGLVVSAETSQQIMELTIDRMLRQPDMETFKLSMATMTGGSGAAAVLLTESTLSDSGHRLIGGVYRAAPRHHRLCRWGPDTGHPASAPMVMTTDAAAVMEHGVRLGVETYRAFVDELGWADGGPDKVVCHQVGAGHRAAVLKAIDVPIERDFSTFEHLGNIGTVSLPLTAAMASEQGFLTRGDRVGMLGIGSGLNCLMVGAEW
jgi:3-oxoacyl-[acyl-carrier-protein] synthase-3